MDKDKLYTELGKLAAEQIDLLQALQENKQKTGEILLKLKEK